MSRKTPSKTKQRRDADNAQAPAPEAIHKVREYKDPRSPDPFLRDMYGEKALDRIYYPDLFPQDCPNPRDDKEGFDAWVAKHPDFTISDK